MFRKLIIFVLAALLTVQPFTATAADLNAAFGNLLGAGSAVSLNQPGNYQSSARNSFVAGGLEMRVPRAQNMPQLFSVTPPRITAGCNGISAHFGGFSFISGEEFEKALKAIASGAALGFVSMMVMKVLCPPCEAVVQFLKTAAQQAARLSKDSCQWGRELAKSFMDGTSSGSNTQEVCGTSISASNTTKDFLSATNDACKSLTSAVDSLLGENPGTQGSDPKSKQDKATLECTIGAGNITWGRLKAFDSAGTDNNTSTLARSSFKTKLLLMNMLGVELGPIKKGDGTSDTTATGASCEVVGDSKPKTFEEGKPDNFCPPTLDAKAAAGLFLCGPPAGDTPYGTQSPHVKSYCATFFQGDGYTTIRDNPVYYCEDSDKESCNHVKLNPNGSILLDGEGFLIQVNKLLLEGVEAVRTNKQMPAKVVQLMQVAPFPLYQAINAAAVYPAAAGDLVDSMSILVAEQLAVAYLDEALRLPGKNAGTKGCLSKEQANKILDAVGSMRAANRERLQQIAQNITTQEVLNEQIRQVNLAIQRQVLSSDMLNQGQFTQSVGRALSPNVPAPGATPPFGTSEGE